MQKLSSDNSKNNDSAFQTNDDTVKYFFMDDPVLHKLKLTQAPKAEVITEYDENGIGVAMHMFDENGKYQGVFDYKKWAEEDKLDKFLNRFETHERYLVKKHIDVDTRKETFVELQKLGFSISEREFNKMNYMYGEGIRIGLALQPFTTKAFGFVGTRYLSLDEYLGNDDLPDIFLHQTYLFDYTGKLKKIYNYNEVGQYLKLFEGGKKGISQYLNSPWDEIPIKYFRFHDFEKNSFLDFDAYTICNNYFREHPIFLGRQYYFGMLDNKVDMVFKGGEKQETYINIVVDTQEKKAYCKVYEIPFQNGHSEWKLFTKPDGIKIDLSEYESIKF